jgi:DNA-directed DNA polymerase III PolC
MKNGLVHLNVHSNYSLLSGAGRIEELLGRAREMGFDTLAITDTNGLYGAMLFLSKAREIGIKPILGAEIRCASGDAVCLARDRNGYANLCRVITARQLDENFSLADALVRHQEGLFILTPDLPLLRRLAGAIEGGRLFHEIRYFADPAQPPFEGAPPVATNNVHFVSPGGRDLHRLLTAIRKNKLLSEVRPDELAPPDAWLKSADEMARRFSGSPFGREAIANTRRIAEACDLQLETGKPIFPKFFSLKEIPPELAGESPRTALRKLALRGMRERYPAPTPEVARRLDDELAVIDDLRFSEYFLIVWDIVNFALRKGIPIVGRGSAANSLAAYCLGITSADPLAHDLYFERFLNRSRTDCPDIDLDLCWRRRDEVLRYVYERHGADRVAMVSNHNTYQARSAFRDVARVFGLPIEEINRLSAMLPHDSAEGIRDAKQLFPEARDFPLDREPYRTLVARAEALDGFPRHLSIHIGGIVIGDRPLTDYLPLERATKGIIVTQFEMNTVEAIGLVKIDLLGHRSLSLIADAAVAVKRNRGAAVALPQIPDGDRETAALLRAGRTIGCFQIESPGMRSLLQMIRAESRRDVIHALSLIRPGPSASGMKERFVRRRLGEEPTAYLDPRLEKVLADTHGVMLFQEDILKVAAVIAGFTLEEGDTLRQAISKKRSPERIAALQERFLRGAASSSTACRRETAEEIWNLIRNFAGYSYCKAHAVTYGVISYQAAYLKAHYPAEFLCAVMANQGGFYETREYLEEARRWGVRILPPDVNLSGLQHSSGGTTLEGRRTPGFIRIGLAQVKGISQRALNSILRARAQRPFASLGDFYFRTQVNDSETERLILCGALGSLARTRPQLLWELRLLSKEIRKSFAGAMGDELFGPEPALPHGTAPPLPEYPIEERIRLEQEILDLSVSDHPLRMFSTDLAERRLARSDQLSANVGRSVTVAGWLVTMRRAVTRNRQYMKFLTLEDRFGTMEVILFPQTYRRFGHLIRSYGPYLVRGRVEQNHRAIGITADWLDKLN